MNWVGGRYAVNGPLLRRRRRILELALNSISEDGISGLVGCFGGG